MKLNSKYFDTIRVKPDEDRTRRQDQPTCQWAGCCEPAEYPAPKGRGRDGQYFHFCLDHVREYNKSYNYFNGMSDEDVANFQLDALTGHRPTWSLGVNSKASKGNFNADDRPNGFQAGFKVNDPFGLFGKTEQKPEAEAEPEERRRPIRNMERKCLRALGVDDTATANEIKSRFKDMVKRHHPDLNGGDTSSVDRLRDIIQAYNYLKQAGLC